MKKYVPRNLPETYPTIGSRAYLDFTIGCFRAIFYYFLVVAICAANHSVDKAGKRTVERLRAIEEKENEREKTEEEKTLDTHCRVRVDASYDEVYRLSTFIMHQQYISYTVAIEEAINACDMTPVPNEDDESSEEESSEDATESDQSDTPAPEEEKKIVHTSIRNWWLFRVFQKYIENHNVPTKHIFWLRVKKNWLLFVYELISFCNHNLLDIIRLINIGMMTVACGTDNFNSLLNILLIIPLTANLKSYCAAPFIAVFLAILLFLEYGLYIVPNKTLLTEWLNMRSMSDQVRNYLMIANISSVYMIPNTITMFCLVIQAQLAREIKNTTEKADMEEKEVELVRMDPESENVDSHEEQRPSLMDELRSWVTLELHNITLVVIFLASVTNTNLLSSVYLIYSLYFLFHPAAMKQVNGKAVRFIKWYAFIHLVVIVIYQLPLFPEPAACQLQGTCIPWMQLIGLSKTVYRSYVGNPTCSLDTSIADEGRTDCPGPYVIKGGILSIVIINIIVNIGVVFSMDFHSQYLVQTSPIYSMVSRHDVKSLLQAAVNNKNLMAIWKKRLVLREKEVTTITSLLYNQLCIILNKVLFVDSQLYAAKDDRFILPPTIESVEETGPYSARLVISVNEKTQPIEETITGFIVGIRKERNDDVPNMKHVDEEVFYPNDDLIVDHQVTLDVTQLKPNCSYYFNVCCLFVQGRTSVATSQSVIHTPPTQNVDTYLWSKIRVKINKYVYDSPYQMQRIETFHYTEPEIDLDELEYSIHEERVREFGSGTKSLSYGKKSPEPKHKLNFTPVTNSEIKELENCDMLLNTQTREQVLEIRSYYRILLRKKSKELGRYDLCRVVNARYFPDKEDQDRSYIRLIVVV